MAKNDDVIIVGSLDKKELEKSIQDLVDYVGDKTNTMANKFTEGLDKMKLAMKDFAITQKVSVDLMKEAWRTMSQSFDAMVAAQSAGGGNNTNGSGKPQYPDNTVGQLEEMIRLEDKRRKGMKLDSDELRLQNKLLEEQRQKLKEQTTSDRTKQLRDMNKQMGAAISMPAKDLQEMEAKLQRLINLQKTFKQNGLLDEQKMNRLQNAIDNVRKKIERIKQTAPKTLTDVMGMDEKSLEQIAAKMRALKRVSIDPKNAQEVKSLGDEYQKLKNLQAQLMGQTVQYTHANNYLAQSFGYIRNRIVYALTLGALTSFTKQIYQVRGEYELLERSLGVLVNSFEQGTRIFQELSQMAIESPFTLMELAGAAKQLTAYNFSAQEVVDTTRRLADLSAALGVPMERLTYNLGQIRAQTVLTARDARDFANAGLPIVKSLADYYTELEGRIVSTGDVYDRMSKKMVSYSDVMAVLNKMTDEGGKFFEFQAKQAETLRVQMANLTLAWNNALNEMGQKTQGLLTLPIKGLKALLQNWYEFDRLIKSLVISFGLLKIAQIAAIKYTQGVTFAVAASDVVSKKFLATMYRLRDAMKAFFTNPWTWVMAGLTLLADLGLSIWRAHDAVVELNEELRKNAQEASQSNMDFLNNKGNIETRKAAQDGALSAERAGKAWESIKQQLNTSASSARYLLSELLTIEDVNERVSKGFDYTESIQKAQAALQDLKDDTIQISSDIGLGGMFGEGLVSDLKDLADQLKEMPSGDFSAGGIATAYGEYREELEETAQSIKNFIDAYKITDPLQIREILERVKAQIKVKNPEIKEELAALFDVTLDRRMAELTEGAVDKNATLWGVFMERLKHHANSTFQGITEDIYTELGKLTPEQKKAVDENLQYFQEKMPWYYDAVKDMVADASQLRIQIGIAFDVQRLTPFQDQVRKRIRDAGSVLDFGSESFLPTQNDDLQSWVKTQQSAISSLQEQNKLYAKDSSEWAAEQIKENERIITQRKNLLDLFNQSYTAEKKTGRTQKQEDVVANALKQELAIIKEMQTNYNKLRKAGVSDTEALRLSAQGYELTIERINAVLQRFGIDKFNASDFAGKNVRQLLDTLTKQRDALITSGKVNISSIKELDVEIQKLTVDAKTYDMKKITEGLNNELGKLKDEYELAIELDANPELGDMFADMFGIDTSTLPHTFGEAYARAVEIAKKQLLELKKATNGTFDVDSFDLMRANFTGDANGLWNGIDVNSEPIKELIKFQSDWRKMFKQNMVETEKMLDDYVKKYGDFSDKIAEIEADRLEQMRKLNEAYYTEEMREMPEYKRKKQAIENAAERLKSQAEWDDFTNTRLYVELFENLELASTDALRAMKQKLDDVKSSMNNLKPEQLKQITAQYMKLEKELMSRNPFKGAVKNAKDYLKAIGSTGKQAQRNFMVAQKDYDAQQKVVAALKEQYEQKKAQEPTNTAAINALAAQLGLEEKKLAKLKEILDASDKEAQKYNMMTKVFKEQASSIAKLLQLIGQNLQSLAELRDNLHDTFGVDLGDEINSAIDGFARVGKGISGAISNAQSGDIFGTINGIVDVFAGIGDGIASLFGDGGARTRKINKEIEKSVETVRQLNMAYKELDVAVNNAMGAQELQARREQIQNKQRQIDEVKRQMQLEQSKRSKDREDDKIKEYQQTIQDLQIEIDELKRDVVSNILGEDIKSAAESFVSAWVDAWREGGDMMESLSEKFDDMIDNMIAKSIASYLVSQRLQRIFDAVDAVTDESSESGAEITLDELKRLKNLVGDKSIAEQINQDLTNLYEALGIAYGVNGKTEKNLSALQQGIQGITEDTAGAIEAYMNGVSQQVYLHSELLTQIRDAVIGFDFDVQVATLSQMLLQLQTNYIVMQSMERMMGNWTIPSGNGIRVEII